jgi:carboxylate-amine ligase
MPTDQGSIQTEQGRVASELLALAEPPDWSSTPRLTLERCIAAFEHDHAFTVGVEEELMLVDPETWELAPAIDEALELVGPDRRFARELRSAQIETITSVCATAADACRELGHARRDLIERLDGRYRLLASGTHPFSTRHGEITDAARYRQLADEYVFAAMRSLVCGLHIHVAVPGAARALAVHNALRSYLPELGALAANSPFCEGEDTGMASVRPQFNDCYPRSGIPPAFAAWDEFVEYVAWGRRGGLFPDPTHFWWEMRLHPLHGTIEIRVADTQTLVEDATAVVSVVQSLAAMLAERYDRDGRLPVHDGSRIAENSWRAYRYGVRGWIVDLDTGERVATRDRIACLLSDLEPYARRFDSDGHLASARSSLAGNGAERQRYVHEREGLAGLSRWLVEQTEASALDA